MSKAAPNSWREIPIFLPGQFLLVLLKNFCAPIRSWRFAFFLSVIVLCLASAPAFSAKVVSECDKLAAVSVDEERTADAVESIPDVGKAFEACSAAVKEYPDEPRYLFLLARVQVIRDAESNDFRESLRLMTDAANRGYVAAQFRLGDIIYRTEKDRHEAEKKRFYWYLTAANNGNTIAQLWTGIAYELGRGVTMDRNEAEAWFRKAAKKKNLNAMYRLSFLLIEKRNNNDLREALKYLEYGRSKDHLWSITLLGKIYINGVYIEKDSSKGLSLLTFAGKKGHIPAAVELGAQYFYGENVPRNKDLSLYWFCKAGEAGTVVREILFGKDETCKQG